MEAIVYIPKVSQRRQIFLVIFCRRKTVAKIVVMLPTFSQTLTLQEALETAAQINEELKIMEFDGAFCKTFKCYVLE